MAEPITIEAVGKTYPGGAEALRDVSLHVAPGMFLVLLGPSGSGKTTLLRCLAGIERVTAGRIAIGATTVAGPRVHVPPDRRGLSMVFQDYALWPHLTARDNVALALRWRRGRDRPSRARCRARAQEMLDRVGLGGLAGRYPNELSGGEQQRVALARALIGGTGLILADEPLSNLDADLRERMRVEISALVRGAGATTVYITHDQAEAFALADTVGVLERGRLVQAGTPEEVYARPATPFVARFTGLAGELGARVRERRRDGTVLVEPDPGGRPFLARGTVPSRRALVLIRQAGVRLCASGADDIHLTGRIADVAFRGRGYEHAVDLGGGTRLTGIFADVRADRGRVVSLRLDPAGCHAFPAEPQSPPARGPRDAERAMVPGPGTSAGVPGR